MEHVNLQRPIRFKLGPNGKLVRSRFLANMEADEEPETVVFESQHELDEAIREKLKEELGELISAESRSQMLDEAADFMTAVATFHENVAARQSDSEIFGDFQDLIQERDLSMQEIAVRRLERDERFGSLEVGKKVMSVLIKPGNPRRQYYLDHPDLFPRAD